MVSITRGVGIGALLWTMGAIPAFAQYGDKAYAPPANNPAAAPPAQQPMVRQPAVKEAKQSGKPTVNELPVLVPQLISPAAQPAHTAPVGANAPRDLTTENTKAAGGKLGQEAAGGKPGQEAAGANGQQKDNTRGRLVVPAALQRAGFLTPNYLNETPNYLLAPLEPAPAQGRMPLISREPTLLGAPAVREPLELPAGGQAYGLTLNVLPVLALNSLELKILKLDEGKIVDLSLPILDLTQTSDAQNGGSFGIGFLPYRVLPWPGVSTHTTAPTAPQQAGAYNPLLAASGLGNIGAIGNIANSIGNISGAGNIGNIGNIGAIGSVGGLGLPALPRY
jgi:hypothetical protein